MSSCKILYINVGVNGGGREGGTQPTGMSLVGLERVNSNLTGCHLLLRAVISLLLSVHI